MARYRKKRVEVDATQWFKNGDHPLDYAGEKTGFENGDLRTWTGEECKANGWEGQIVRYYRNPSVPGDKPCQHCEQIMHNHGWIDTLEGGHIVCPGDWIITGIAGERYPVKDHIFLATYEKVEDALSEPL